MKANHNDEGLVLDLIPIVSNGSKILKVMYIYIKLVGGIMS